MKVDTLLYVGHLLTIDLRIGVRRAFGSTFPTTIDPSLGVRSYKLDEGRIKALPDGADTPFDHFETFGLVW